MDLLLELPEDVKLDDPIDYKLTELNTDSPLLVLNGRRYRGQYEQMLGTALVFQNNSEDALGGYKGKTSYKIVFKAEKETDNE